jgi:serine/threonine protein kinase/outer membrane murein-binding lipoprotein Lpp
MSNSESEHYDLLDRLAEEFAERFRRGERPALKEYTDRYPELADDIRELFPAMVKVEQAEGLRHGEDIENTPARNALPKQIGDYRILRELGRGGMGVVYEAEQVSLGRRVALKVLPRQASGDRMIRERFRREARAAARLHHTNIVPVFEVGQDGDVRFYAMQFIEGQGLDLVIAELRRLRDPSRPEPKIRAASESQPITPHGENPNGGKGGRIKGDEFEVSLVVRSILNGRFDAGDWLPERPHASNSNLASTVRRGLTTQAGTGVERRPVESDPARKATELDSTPGGDTIDSAQAYRPAPALSSTNSSGSAILPGGTQLSSVESGHHKLFRSLAQIGRQVAAGLAYAHARGIVHRDIKPSNLLLDTEGVVWITDFGLAKGDDEELTQSGDILGTIRYMAPERFRGEGNARADVYALGLTLYELLTLRPGFESAGRLSMIEQIKSEEPLRPRAIDPRIPRDLETIVLKAIEKDPKARYQSADAMGEDLQRFLADEPIRARQVGTMERYWRLARRNPEIAGLGAALIGVLMLATGVSLAAMDRFRTQAKTQHMLADAREAERQAADAARAQVAQANIDLEASVRRESRINGELRTSDERSRRRFELALEAANGFQTQAAADPTLREPKFADLRRELLGAVLVFYTKLQGALEGDSDPRARSDLAAAYVGAARITVEIGSVQHAVDAFRRAMAIDEALIASDPTDVRHRAALAETLVEAARPIWQIGSVGEAMQMSRRALAIYEALSRAHPGDLMIRSGLSEAVAQVGYYQARTGAMVASLESTKQAVRLSEEVVRAAPSDEMYRSRLAVQLATLGDRLHATGRRPESLVAYTRALEFRQQLADERPEDTARARALGFSLFKMGFAHRLSGALGKATAYHRRALKLREKLASTGASSVLDRRALADSLTDMGYLELQAGHLHETEVLYRQAVSLRERVFEENPKLIDSLNKLAEVLLSLGNFQAETRRATEALATLHRAADLAGRAAQSAPEDSIYQYILGMSHDAIGRAERQIGAPARALEAHRLAVTVFDRLSTAEPDDVTYRSYLTRNLLDCASLERPTSSARATASLDRARLVLDESSQEEPSLRYDLAAEYARLVGPTTVSTTPDSDAARQRCASHALAALARLVVAGYRDRQRIESDPAFDGIRGHPEFQSLMLDLAFPASPFAR